MARKGLLDSVMGAEPSSAQKESRAGYALHGASRSMKLSIDDMAENIAIGEAFGFHCWQYQSKEHHAFEVWLSNNLGLS